MAGNGEMNEIQRFAISGFVASTFKSSEGTYNFYVKEDLGVAPSIAI